MSIWAVIVLTWILQMTYERWVEGDDQAECDEYFDEHLDFAFEEKSEEWDDGPRSYDLEEPKGDPLGGLISAAEGAQEWEGEAGEEDQRRQKNDEKHQNAKLLSLMIIIVIV